MTDPGSNERSAVFSESVIERLAAIEHDRWSHWQRHLHTQCVPADDGSLIIPSHLVQRWARLMFTQYEHLSELEKASDREQVRRYLPVIAEAIDLEQQT